MPARDEVDVANVLLTKALGDEAGLRALREHPEVPDEVVGFHAQQAVEKQIKAVLTARGIRFDKTHELSYLVGLIDEHKIDAPPALEEAEMLTDWAVEFRYPGDEPPALDRAGALTLVVEIREWAEAQIAAVGSETKAAAEQEPSTESDSGQSSTPSS
jgi:HEPN domain-containing protein